MNVKQQIRMLKLSSIIKEAQDAGVHEQSWQPGDYAKELKKYLGIDKYDNVDLNSTPINDIYSAIEKHGFSGDLNITLGVSPGKQTNLNFVFKPTKPFRNQQLLIKDIKAVLLPPINQKLKTLPNPSADFEKVCSVNLTA